MVDLGRNEFLNTHTRLKIYHLSTNGELRRMIDNEIKPIPEKDRRVSCQPIPTSLLS